MSTPNNRHSRVVTKTDDASANGFGLRSLVILAVPLALLLLGGTLLFWPTEDDLDSPLRETARELDVQPDFPPVSPQIEQVPAETDSETDEPRAEEQPVEAEARAGKQIENSTDRGPLGEPVEEDLKELDEEQSKERPDSLEGMFPRDINDEMPEGTWPRGSLLTLPSVKPPFEWKTLVPSKVLTRIGVGSCLSQSLPQPIWDDVLALGPRPDLFLMIGDNVYGDIKSSDYRELIEAYRRQGRHADFSRAGTSFPFLATWDDHDYGRNDAGGAFPHKVASAKLFSDFWQIETGRAEGEGIYYSKMIGPPGKQVHIIFLDTRSFRSELTRKQARLPYWGKYQPELDQARTMLGAAQWAWFEEELKRPADLRFVVSSVQVLAAGHGFERWGNFPHELKRLLELLNSSSDVPSVVLSGDRHMGAFYRLPLSKDRVLLEVTASSLNRSYGPSKDVASSEVVSEFYHQENFALIDIDWEKMSLKLSLRGLHGEIFHATNTPFVRLGGGGGTLLRGAR